MDDETTDLLALGDALAQDLLAGLSPLRFTEVADEDERRAGFRLRYEAVVERGMADPGGFPDGLEVDAYDERAIHIVGWDGRTPVATCRLVLPTPGCLLPVEATFGVTVPGAADMVDWGRVVVAASHRGADHALLMGLAAQGWQSMRSRGFSSALGATPPRLTELFRELGFSVSILGPAALHWGEERVPFLCEGRAAMPGLTRKWGDSTTVEVASRDEPGASS